MSIFFNCAKFNTLRAHAKEDDVSSWLYTSSKDGADIISLFYTQGLNTSDIVNPILHGLLIATAPYFKRVFPLHIIF